MIKKIAFVSIVFLSACGDAGDRSIARMAVNEYLEAVRKSGISAGARLASECFRELETEGNASQLQRCYSLEVVNKLTESVQSSNQNFDENQFIGWLTKQKKAVSTLHGFQTYTNIGASYDVGKWEGWLFDEWRRRRSDFKDVIHRQ